VSAALSASGDIALIGGLDDNSSRGAAWVFTRTGSTWTQQGAKLTGADEAGEGEFGTNVALSADGNTALVGAWRDNGGVGAAWVFASEAEGKTPTTETTVTPPPSLPPPSPTPPPSPPPGEKPPPPVLRDVRQSVTRWREGGRLAHLSLAKPPVGTTFSFSLSEQATVTFSFTRLVAGRKVGGRCVAQGVGNRAKPACTRRLTAGSLPFSAHGGSDRVAFQGRISSARKLAPGRYTLTITARDAAGLRSAPALLSFTIVG
jgi:hypothetical protein